MLFFYAGDVPKSELARDQGVSLQSEYAPSGASGDLEKKFLYIKNMSSRTLKKNVII